MDKEDRKSSPKLPPGAAAKTGTVAAGKRPPRSALAPRCVTAKSAITNGTVTLPDIDGRSRIARRYRDIAAACIGDGGGIERMSEARLQLSRRFAGASALAEQIEADMAMGRPVDISAYATLVSTAVRVGQRIGLNRVAKRIPTLEEYLAAKAAEQDDDTTDVIDVEEPA